jgi:Sec63 Brl domain
VEDAGAGVLLHSEAWTLTKKMAHQGPQRLGFTIPLREPLPNALTLRLVSDSWLQVSHARVVLLLLLLLLFSLVVVCLICAEWAVSDTTAAIDSAGCCCCALDDSGTQATHTLCVPSGAPSSSTSSPLPFTPPPPACRQKMRWSCRLQGWHCHDAAHHTLSCWTLTRCLSLHSAGSSMRLSTAAALPISTQFKLRRSTPCTTPMKACCSALQRAVGRP